MNLLPFVFFIFILLSFSNYFFLQKNICSEKIAKIYSENFLDVRDFMNVKEEKIYKREKKELIKETKEKETTPEPPDHTKPPKPRKESKKGLHDVTERVKESYLNIYPLLRDGKIAHPLLYKTLTKLINLLYKDTKKNEALLLVDAILESIDKKQFQKNGEIRLEKTVLKNQKMQHLFYKILKGGKNPSIFNFIKIKRDSEYILGIQYAPIELLKVLFGEDESYEIYNHIHKTEGEKSILKPLSKKETEILINRKIEDELDSFCTFSTVRTNP